MGNPAKKFIEYSSKNNLTYYDKERGEEVSLGDKAFFVPLKNLVTIKGYFQPEQSGIYSNEVFKTSEQELTVKSHKGTEIAKGLYKDIKFAVKGAGGKYTKSIYGALLVGSKGNQEVELVNFQLKGSGLTNMFDLKYKAKDCILEVFQDPEIKTNGNTKYKCAGFNVHPITDELKALIEPLDKEITDYLNEYMGNAPQTTQATAPQVTPAPIVADDSEPLPF